MQSDTSVKAKEDIAKGHTGGLEPEGVQAQEEMLMDLTERYQGEESCEKRLLGKKFPSRLCLPGLQRGQLLRRCTGMHTPMVVHEIFNTGFSLTADTMMENTHLPSGRGLWPSGS